MFDLGLILAASLIAIIFFVYDARNVNHREKLLDDKQVIVNELVDARRDIERLRSDNDYLRKVKTADEHIFDLIRCINVPQAPSCKDVDGGGVCRSRLIDCNKYKLVLENDPIAVERMKVATHLYTDAEKTPNPSELTNPVRSGWYY